jgi:3-oxoacyl-[acyl-carrier protein] reductase
MWDFSGRRVVVTGAGSAIGIGFESARVLADLGASVALLGLSERVIDRANELNEMGFDAIAARCDLTDADATFEVFEMLADELGGIDVLVNNAGMTSHDNPAVAEMGGVAEISYAGWQAAIARNLDTAFLATKAALPYLRASGSGRIIMISSVTGPHMAMRNLVAYAAGKGGMNGLIRRASLLMRAQRDYVQRGVARLDSHRGADRPGVRAGIHRAHGSPGTARGSCFCGRVAGFTWSLVHHRSVDRGRWR